MSDFAKYIKNIRKQKGITLRDFEKRTGISRSYLSLLENGRRDNPSPEVIKKISEVLGIDFLELMSRSNMLILKDDDSEFKDSTLPILMSNLKNVILNTVCDENGDLKAFYKKKLIEIGYKEEFVDLNKELIIKMIDSLSYSEQIQFLNIFIDNSKKETQQQFVAEKVESYNANSFLKIPVLGTVAAGVPIYQNEDISEYISVVNKWNYKYDDLFALKVKGDSMINSRIFDGDMILVKVQNDVENGEIAVVSVNGEEATLKRVKKINGKVILYPDNPNYEPIFIDNENAKIIGKVIQVIFEP